MEHVIECKNLCHSYGKKPALRDVSWTLKPGRICGLLGRNGAGKTTTINILNAFLSPSGGNCYLLGEDSRKLSAAVKSRIGYLIEGHVQYGFFNASQIERFYASFYPNWKSSIYQHLISRLDIDPKQKIASMSCGQRSQVALGLILAQDPDLIVLDDYSMGLDPGYRRLFIDVIRDYAADGRRSILLTSHIIQDLEGLIDDIIIYDKGRVLVDSQAEEFTRRYARYSFQTEHPLAVTREDGPELLRIEPHPKRSILSGYLGYEDALQALLTRSIPFTDLRPEPMSLEERFIALTGKY